MEYADLIVVGAGVLGTFHAFHAARLGLKTILIEKDLAPQDATVRNFGQVVPQGQWEQFGIESTRIRSDLSPAIARGNV